MSTNTNTKDSLHVLLANAKEAMEAANLKATAARNAYKLAQDSPTYDAWVATHDHAMARAWHYANLKSMTNNLVQG